MLLTRNTSNHNPAGRQQQQQPLRQQQQQQHSEPQGSVVVGIHHYSGSWMDWDSNSKRKEEQQLNEEVGWSTCGAGALLVVTCYKLQILSLLLGRTGCHMHVAVGRLVTGHNACVVLTLAEGIAFKYCMQALINL
jgi:hypothetical protein